MMFQATRFEFHSIFYTILNRIGRRGSCMPFQSKYVIVLIYTVAFANNEHHSIRNDGQISLIIRLTKLLLKCTRLKARSVLR